MNFIIFGGTGFIGTHLVNLISEMHPDDRILNLDIVHSMDRDVAGKCNYVFCDVRMPISNFSFVPSRDDVVIHLAAIHRTPGHPDYDYFETNIRGAENVCAFCELYGIRNVVFLSSIAIYGTSEGLKTEETLPMPDTPYGISKLVAEKIFMVWKNAAVERKLTILRPGVVFGRGENGNFTRLYRSLKRHLFAYPGRKDTVKACIYVKELADFIMWNIEKRFSSSAIFNCTYEPAFTIEQIVTEMKKRTGLMHWVPLVPPHLIRFAAFAAKIFGSPMGICPERVRKLQISTNVGGEKMKSCGYKSKWTFSDAISDWLGDNDGKGLE